MRPADVDRLLREANPRFEAVAGQVRPDGDVVLSEDAVGGFHPPKCLVCQSGLVKPEQIARAVTEEASPELAAERLVDLANASGGPDNITVVVARFAGTGLESAAPVDEVGHRVFDSPDLVTPVSISPIVRVEALPAIKREPRPPLEPLFPPVERQKRGTLYVRVLAAVGIGLTLLFLWQILTRL